MDIFESLESLPVSEACFEDIISIIESILNEEDELSPNKERHLKKLTNNIVKAYLKKQSNPSKANRDKVDAAYNKHANIRHKYYEGDKYSGLSPKELAQANGYLN
jgi:hypothetical protein